MGGVFEKWCETTANEVDNWSDTEKKFVLWLLLDYYKEEIEDDIKFVPKDIGDYIQQEMMKTHIKSCEQIREIIGYELW